MYLLCFSKDHVKPNLHNCNGDVRVPVCPICNKPVPTPKGMLPDIAVSNHIDRDCRFQKTCSENIYVNKCSVENCRKKEVLFKNAAFLWYLNTCNVRCISRDFIRWCNFMLTRDTRSLIIVPDEQEIPIAITMMRCTLALHEFKYPGTVVCVNCLLMLLEAGAVQYA
ncbi:unnamed protein product [Soboliphyme baturini]|uniref:RING-type E3 ubiquitin transferase n=1 Tax=Soboliphyme baturini TaxID=241478 RepID=A0A183JAW9_9BILA|nr:unnamed protein product [Soboliphyme baturini]